MKLSMWFIKKQLDPYVLQSHIEKGDLVIDSFRIIDETGLDSVEESIAAIADHGSSVIIYHDQDYLEVNCSLAHVINGLAELFRHYNTWEMELNTLLMEQASQQAILEKFEEVCSYPIVFMELDGSILAISRDYSENELDDAWFHMKNSLQVPMGKDRSRYDEVAEGQYVNEEPQYVEKGDNSYIAMYFVKNKIRFMGMIVVEHEAPFTKDIYQLCEILSYHIKRSRELSDYTDHLIRTKASIVYDLLENNPVGAQDLDRFYENEDFIYPWKIIVIKSTAYSTEEIPSFITDWCYKNPRMITVALNYQGNALIMVRAEDVERLIRDINCIISFDYYKIGISLSFYSLQNLSLKYEQAMFAMNIIPGPGVRHCEQYALDYMISCIRRDTNAVEMIHPALNVLKHADERKNSQLYDTLKQYLNHDKNIILTANAMFVHRNSMMYRINKIKEFTRINFEDEKECEYLRISYLLVE